MIVFFPLHKITKYKKTRYHRTHEKKIKGDSFFIKTIGLGPRRFHCFTEFFTGIEFDLPSIKLHYIVFHAASIHLLKIYFQV